MSDFTEMALLRHEMGKQRRHLPVRQLVSRSTQALLALKPCFLMSPLSVAQYLPPGEVDFDLVVMDEASQLRPEDALGAVARGRRVVVVGDPKQLPPTSFFDTTTELDEDADETVVDDAESILEVCQKQFPFRRLRWHYRSRHESLIDFSNKQFYDGDLIAFPSPQRESRDVGVHFNFIDQPSYERGKNRNEARVVVEAVRRHLLEQSDKTLGVVALNKRQAEEIQLLLENAARQDPNLDRVLSEQDEFEPLFVKNLENVQGDERDVIFISVTYGPAKKEGKVFQRFGPINSDNGWRRLNVLATRARERIEVFSSMRSSDIHVNAQTRRGPRALRDYLAYAETGQYFESPEVGAGEFENDFEAAVGRFVEGMDYQCVPQVGVSGFFIDLGVVNPDSPGEFLLGIECDGAAYHSAQSVRDRDRLRQEILEEKGWHIHRIWSTNWFHNREQEVTRLRKVLEEFRVEARLRARPQSAPSQDPVPQPDSQEPIPEDEDEMTEESLAEALERFWLANIKPLYPDRSRSVLSKEAIKFLVERKPTSKQRWLETMPSELRENTNPSEVFHLADILRLIAEYG